MKSGRKPKGTTLKSRILDQIKIAQNGCWIWTGRKREIKKIKDRNGDAHSILNYGIIKVNGKPIGAHRASWMAFKGEIPLGKIICHNCDNPPCVNPDHLFIGTHQLNSDDCKNKKRNAAGERHSVHKITASKVAKIHSEYKAWDRKHSMNALSEKFGVSSSVIFKILNGQWGDGCLPHPDLGKKKDGMPSKRLKI